VTLAVVLVVLLDSSALSLISSWSGFPRQSKSVVIHTPWRNRFSRTTTRTRTITITGVAPLLAPRFYLLAPKAESPARNASIGRSWSAFVALRAASLLREEGGSKRLGPWF